MAKFHNGKNGPARCTASIRECPVGGEHFPSMGEAEKAFEKEMTKTHGVFSVQSKTHFKKYAAIGGALLSTVSLAACNSQNAISNTNNAINNGAGAIEQASNQQDNSQKSVTDQLKDKFKQKLENKLDQIENSKNSSDSSSSSVGQQDSSGVYFQGKSLKVSKDEVEKAQQMLNSFNVVKLNTDADYNRSQQFGRSFESGVVGRMEHRDITNGEFKNSAPQSRAIGGSFVSPYTGKTVNITKGSKTDSDVDHLVPLKRIVELGADKWTQAKRLQYANDANNIAVVDSSSNREKGDKGPSEWLPSYEPAQCSYVVHQVEILHNYQLPIDQADKSAIQNVIDNRCGE